MIIFKHPKVAEYGMKSINLEKKLFNKFVVEILSCNSLHLLWCSAAQLAYMRSSLTE